MDDLVDVVRIRLRTPANATALLSEFRRADQLLASWASRPESSPVEFEVTFFDGYVIRGCYAFVSKGKLKRSLSAHVRQVLRCVGPAEEATSASGSMLSRYLVPF